MIKKRLHSAALALCILLALLPIMAFAGAESKNVMPGVGGIDGSRESHIYFGTYPQSADGEGGFDADPIKWRVLEDNGDYYVPAGAPDATEFEEGD